MKNPPPDLTGGRRDCKHSVSLVEGRMYARNAPVQVWTDFVGLAGADGVALSAPCLEETCALRTVTWIPNNLSASGTNALLHKGTHQGRKA